MNCEDSSKGSLIPIFENKLFPLSFSQRIGNRVSTSSGVDKVRSINRPNAGSELTGNDTASDEDSQLSYSTTGSPTPNANSQTDSSPVASQASPVKSGSSGKVHCKYDNRINVED